MASADIGVSMQPSVTTQEVAPAVSKDDSAAEIVSPISHKQVQDMQAENQATFPQSSPSAPESTAAKQTEVLEEQKANGSASHNAADTTADDTDQQIPMTPESKSTVEQGSKTPETTNVETPFKTASQQASPEKSSGPSPSIEVDAEDQQATPSKPAAPEQKTEVVEAASPAPPASMDNAEEPASAASAYEQAGSTGDCSLTQPAAADVVSPSPKATTPVSSSGQQVQDTPDTPKSPVPSPKVLNASPVVVQEPSPVICTPAAQAGKADAIKVASPAPSPKPIESISSVGAVAIEATTVKAVPEVSTPVATPPRPPPPADTEAELIKPSDLKKAPSTIIPDTGVVPGIPGLTPPISTNRTPRTPSGTIPLSEHDKQNTTNASQLLKQAAFKLQPLKDFIPYDELMKLRLEDGIDPTVRENYLKDEDFQTVFGFSREVFQGMPRWKQIDAKKRVKLF